MSKQCYQCGSANHRARECPKAVCRLCGQIGHDVGGCPKKPLPPVSLGKFNNNSHIINNDSSTTFTYIELFAGMGGFRVALDKLGGKCVFASEVDRFCIQNYKLNFGHVPAGDICRIENGNIPDHDLLVGGFPCQPFSSSGSRLGVNDSRGLLFREITRILKCKQPKIFVLENVRGLFLQVQTLSMIVQELVECGYKVQHELINAVHLLPQERWRLYFVGIRNDLVVCSSSAYKFPILPDLQRGVKDILDTDTQNVNVLKNLILNPNQLHKIQNQKYTQQHPEARFLSNLEVPAKTIQSSYMSYMVGSQFVPVGAIDDDGGDCENTKSKGHQSWRRFSAREVARLQGFPENFQLCKYRAHHMVGNSVCPPVISMIVAPLLQHVHLAVCNDDGDWGWRITKTILLESAPCDARKTSLQDQLSEIVYNSRNGEQTKPDFLNKIR